ncbi:MAG: cytochrome c biogenesis protein CcsA [Bacteroidetes bacterium]|jgi:heme exporter protein C|nr:cytochrome c biogenesis protein CcsA [Bacteroidota bacterium]
MAAALLLVYTVVVGLMGPIPQREILYETIRNLYFHVPMWFAMIFLFIASMVHAVRYLYTSKPEFDTWSVEFANIGLLFGFLGITTGMIWAQFTWGAWWSFDPKQNGAAITLLLYLAYMVLRNSIGDPKTKGRVSAVYNVFAFFAMVPLIFILPRLTESLHPGAEGNPGFNSYDLDGDMRRVFYPAVLGWAMLAVWMVQLRVRLKMVKEHLYENSI